MVRRRTRYLAFLFVIALPVAALLWACQSGRFAQGTVPTSPTSAKPGEATPSAAPASPEATGTLEASDEERYLYLPYLGIQRTPTTPTAIPGPTEEPRPTPTPTMPWPEALSEPGNSKLGLHVQWNNSPEIMEFIRRMKPAVVKSVGDLGFMDEVKEVSPSTVTIARLDDEGIAMEGDPVAAARAFVARNLDQYLRHPAVDYWEGVNEPGVNGAMDWFAAFEAERVRAMAEHGLKTAVGAFSTGVPEWNDFERFLPAIQAAKENGGILVLHEYDAPTMERTVGQGLPEQAGRPDRGVLVLRYRWWYEEFLKPRGLVVPLVISEAGVDGLVGNRPGPAKGRGWRDFVDYWTENGLGGDPIQTYLNQLAWYDAELQKDPYVVGCAVFTAGAMNEDWQSYDITPILRHIATYILAPAAKAQAAP
ncbi:MAG: hypothetical protein ACYC4R_02360 [Anaerolineae bacterium]